MLDEDTPAAGGLVGVRVGDPGRLAVYDAGALALQDGDQVIVESDLGAVLGTVERLPFPPADGVRVARRVVRRADANDLGRTDWNQTREREALRLCLERINARGLPMKLVQATRAAEGGKIVFYFAAEDRVDFRELVRELSHLLHTRVELKQVGSRDEAKMVGAVGPCGRELCCSTWLKDFAVVSVKMAKAQGLALNPSKLAGMCGRLKCCLRYEYDSYLELGKRLPAVGKKAESVKGNGVVARQNLFKQTVVLRLEDGTEVEATLDDLVVKKAP